MRAYEHHYRAYGFCAPAVAKFGRTGITRWAGAPQFQALLRIEDPYSYRDRLVMPKFIINSAGDQYFLPDSSQFYFDGLSGEKYLRYISNTDHSLKGAYQDAAESAVTFLDPLGKESGNALLHRTPIQHRCEDHWLVCRHESPVINGSQAPEAVHNPGDAVVVCDELRDLCPRNAPGIKIELAQDDQFGAH